MHKCIMLVFWNSRAHTDNSTMFFCWHYELSLTHTLGPSSLLLNRATRLAAWLTHTNQPTQTCQQPFKMSHTHTHFFTLRHTCTRLKKTVSRSCQVRQTHMDTRCNRTDFMGRRIHAWNHVCVHSSKPSERATPHAAHNTTHHFTGSHCFHHICQSCSHSTALWATGDVTVTHNDSALSFFTRGLL